MDFISILIYFSIAFAAGIGLLGMSLGISYLNLATYTSYLNTISTSSALAKVIIFLTGSLIILIFLRFVQKGFTRHRREKSIKTETENGSVSVTLTAIEDMIKKTLSAEEIISRIRPKIISTRKEVIIYVILTLKEAVNIKDFAHDIQAKLEEKLQSLLGKDKILRINIEIKKIVFPKKGSVEEESDEEEEEGPLRKY